MAGVESPSATSQATSISRADSGTGEPPSGPPSVALSGLPSGRGRMPRVPGERGGQPGPVRFGQLVAP